MVSGEIVRINGVWNQLVGYACLVKQSGCIGFLDFHDSKYTQNLRDCITLPQSLTEIS